MLDFGFLGLCAFEILLYSWLVIWVLVDYELRILFRLFIWQLSSFLCLACASRLCLYLDVAWCPLSFKFASAMFGLLVEIGSYCVKFYLSPPVWGWGVTLTLKTLSPYSCIYNWIPKARFTTCSHYSLSGKIVSTIYGRINGQIHFSWNSWQRGRHGILQSYWRVYDSWTVWIT